MLGGIGSAETDPAETLLLVGGVAVVNAGGAAISVLERVVDAHVLALHVSFDDKALCFGGVESFFDGCRKLGFAEADGHSHSAATVHRLDHNGILYPVKVFAAHIGVDTVLRYAVDSVAFAGGFENILVGKYVNDLLRGVAVESENVARLAVSGNENVGDSDQNAVDIFPAGERHNSRNIGSVHVAAPYFFAGSSGRLLVT